MGLLFHETGKLISEQKEITGVSTIDFKEPAWMSTSSLCSKAYQITNAKAYVFSDSVLCVGKWETILLQLGRVIMVFGKQSLQGYESNRRYADRARVDNVPKNHNVGPPRKFLRGHWSFLGLGSEKKWYATSTDKPDGSKDRMAQDVMRNFTDSGHPIVSPVLLSEAN